MPECEHTAIAADDPRVYPVWSDGETRRIHSGGDIPAPPCDRARVEQTETCVELAPRRHRSLLSQCTRGACQCARNHEEQHHKQSTEAPPNKPTSAVTGRTHGHSHIVPDLPPARR